MVDFALNFIRKKRNIIVSFCNNEFEEDEHLQINVNGDNYMKNLTIATGDIIDVANKYNVEAIVNPNNKYMDYGCRCMWCYIRCRTELSKLKIIVIQDGKKR